MSRRDSNFSQTDWSMIGRVAGDDAGAANAALESLVRRYWPAVYAFIRRTGRDVHEASDLTQAFIADVVLHRRLIHGADRTKGRFRQLLLRALRNFLHENHRSETRLKRTPASGRVVSLEGGAEPDTQGDTASPEAAFDVVWCRTLVRGVLARVRAECVRDSLELHWEIFEARVVGPVLHGTAPIEYAELATRLGLPSRAHAANMAITVKRRFAKALREEIAVTVQCDEELELELHDVLRLAGR